jgi:NAD(P)-dependent dehydrogenase (short-subunit alcohol dehydrogenase family)
MKGKTVLITGGISGIGRASSIAFAKAGANVFIIDINDAESNSVLNEVTSLGAKAFYYKADVTKENEVSDAISKCVEEHKDFLWADRKQIIELVSKPVLDDHNLGYARYRIAR